MAQRAQPVRGMRDIVPPGEEVRRRVANRILDTYASYGFEAISTPALEDLAVLVGSQGGENEKLIFKVMKRGERLEDELASGGELADAGLRFDLTVPLARFVANHLNELPMPFKVAHIAPVWRAERPQKGRYREFVQCDIDIVGEPELAAEVELCSATLDALSAVGLPGCTVRLNDRRLLRSTVERYLGPQDDPSAIFVTLDKLDKVGAAKVADDLVAAGHDRPAVARLVDHLGAGELLGGTDVDEALRRSLAALAAQGFAASFDPTLVRGMGYYTGQIFEVSHPDVGYSLAGGGRYDGMTARFGGPDLPMCGFSIGFERVCDLIGASFGDGSRHKIAVVCDNDEDLLRCLAAARTGPPRSAGAVVSVVRRARNARKQQEDLGRLGYTEILEGRNYRP